jgi:ArsR family transcriptional regulator
MQLQDPVAALLRVLSDPTRLRILALLEREELSVGELSRSLEMAQSRVSNHLRLLREAELLTERHAGTSTFLRFSEAGRGLAGLAGEIWAPLRARLAQSPEHAADVGRLEQVLAERSGDPEAFFDRVASHWDKIGVDFATGQARERAAASLLPAGLTLADLGCGTGYFAHSLLGLGARLVCIDRSPAMVAEARAQLERAALGTALEFHVAELDRLPLAAGMLDGLVCGMVLHHLADLEAPLVEMARVLKPGAAAVVLELMPHKQAWMQREHGDRHLGLEPKDVLAAFARAGFEDVRLEPARDHYRPRRRAANDLERPELSLYIVRGRKPLAPA